MMKKWMFGVLGLVVVMGISVANAQVMPEQVEERGDIVVIELNPEEMEDWGPEEWKVIRSWLDRDWYLGELHQFHATPEQVAEWRAAAEQGDADAQAKLGSAYATGKGVAKDNREAARWLRMAAEQGNASAQYFLGSAYVTGEGVAEDLNEAARWLRMAAAQEHPGAQTALRNIEVEVWRAAAEQGDADAQFNLGNAYYYGRGVAEDFREAVRWLRMAAEQGHAGAPFTLSLMYYIGKDVYVGKGTTEDNREAYIWFFIVKASGDGIPVFMAEVNWRDHLSETEINSAQEEAIRRMEAIKNRP